MDIFYKDPQDRADYHCEWQMALQDDDYLTVSAWVVPVGLLGSDEALFVGYENDLAGNPREVQRASIFLAGGTVGEAYTVTNRITTARGRQLDRSFQLRIQEN